MDSSTLPVNYIWTLFLCKVAVGYNTCSIGGARRYCENGCCSVGSAKFCCLTTYVIIGIVFGCIAAVCCIVSIIICILQQKKRNGQVLAQPTRVMVVSAQTSATVQPPGYASIKPLPPGYASHYDPTYPPGLHPYGTNNQPPPAYSYNSPHTNNFAETYIPEINNSNKQQQQHPVRSSDHRLPTVNAF